ncbi:MAG TPA: PKD domain-containing protein, partial [Chitinophagaceae bacterium]|nr:PKD domain-containing protein [Chitinophagaceae bacterium]
MKKHYILFLLIFLLQGSLFGQITFQQILQQPDSASSLQTFDSKATPDGGYILAGLSSEGSTNVFHPFIMKLNCKGEAQWQKVFGTTQSTANVYTKVIVTQDSGYAMISNVGVYTNYNGFAVRLDPQGNILWQKTLNLSSGNDNINDIMQTSNGQFLITGSVKSTPDVGLVKLDQNGNLIWSKTYGNAGEYDEGSAVIETSDGGYLITGRYISMGTFNAFLLKTDTAGTYQWLKCYGDTLQHMWGMDVKEMANGDFIMAGSTTLLKTNYQAWSDNYVMRLNHSGDTLWTKIFYGTPDQFENVANILIDAQQQILLSVATASYPTAGFVPNKQAIMKFDGNGNLIDANTYNGGYSHYPRIAPCPDGTYVMSGFSTAYTGPVGFQTLVIKMDANLISGCNQTDVSALTTVTSKNFKVTTPTPLTSNTGSVIANVSTYVLDVVDSTLCSSFPIVQAVIQPTNGCINTPISFQAPVNGISYWHWDFGDLTTANDTALIASPNYTYASSGTYTVTLIVSNGCESDTLAQAFTVDSPLTHLGLGADLIICKDSSAEIGTTVFADSYSWNTGDTTATITVNQ